VSGCPANEMQRTRSSLFTDGAALAVISVLGRALHAAEVGLEIGKLHLAEVCKSTSASGEL